MELPSILKQEIVDFLLSLPNIHDSDSQRAFIYHAGLDSQLRVQIPFDKPPIQFVPILVSLTLKYGRLDDGRYAIEVILEATKNYIGQDKNIYCTRLLQKLHRYLSKQPFQQHEQPYHISLSKLPRTQSELFGRDHELEKFDEAWNNAHTHILMIVAWGGVGKTSIVNEWLNRIERDNYCGAEYIYGWSFYSQGTREERQVSADDFINQALLWFGDPDPEYGSTWDKGVRLANLVRQHRTLLILDGMEPLQYPPGKLQGQLKDQGLQALLKELARANNGLCIITTRIPIDDIKNMVNSTVLSLPLPNLSVEAGIKLLKSLGVKETIEDFHPSDQENELKKAVQEFEGHALALQLLATYLVTVYNGDIRQRDKIKSLNCEGEQQHRHAKRIMESYEIWMKNTEEWTPMLNILYIMGLFDRPAESEAINAVLAEPPITGLITAISYQQWQFAVKRLRDIHLLAQRDSRDFNILDCHPLIRDYFGEKFRQNLPEAWKEAHKRLYEYYQRLPQNEFPETLKEMEPLYAAVRHGCQAGLYQEAYSMYKERILRKKEFYSTKKLGAFGADLAAISNFFESPWEQPCSALSDKIQANLLGMAGFRLRALGRLDEAAKTMRLEIEMRVKQEIWEQASITAGNLSELYLIMGRIKEAITYAQQSVNFADRGDGSFR